MAEITFASTDKHIELQAADLLAYRARQTSHRLALGKESSTKRMDKDLGLGNHVIFACDDAVSLRRKVLAVQRNALKWEFPPEKTE
jgi:hypothetical protein